jgi:hypothetical protein
MEFASPLAPGDSVLNFTASCIDSQTRDNALKNQRDHRNKKMQIPVLKEGNTNLVIPGQCQKGTFSTSTKINQVTVNSCLTNNPLLTYGREDIRVLTRTLILGVQYYSSHG